MMNLVRTLGLLAMLFGLTGCGKTLDAPPGESVDITGKVTLGGKSPPAGTRIVLQPISGSGQQVFFTLKGDGLFSGKANAAEYTYYIEPGTMNEAAFEKVAPKESRSGSMERKIEVKAGAGTLELKL